MSKDITELQNYSLEQFFGIYAKDDTPLEDEFGTIDDSIETEKAEAIAFEARKSDQYYENSREKEA